MEQLGGFQDGHGEEAVPAAGLGGGQRLQVGHAALLGELREDEAGEQADGGAEAAHQVGDLLGVADPDEEERGLGLARLGTGGEVGELGHEVGLGTGDVGVGDRVLQAEDHRDDAAGGLLVDVVGEGGARGRAVQRRPQGGGQDGGRRLGREDGGLPVEEAPPRFRGKMPEMTHVNPP